MSNKEIDRISALIYTAPLGQYIGAEGASILAEKSANERHLEDNEFLYKKGEATGSFYIVTGGRLAIVRETNGGDVSILHVLQKGDLVGELSFIDGTPHTASVCALGEATVLCFKAEDINLLIMEHPKLIYDFMRAVIKRVHHTVAAIGQQQSDLVDYVARGGSGRF